LRKNGRTRPGRGLSDKVRGYFYEPFSWRGFLRFRCGALGDMACHILALRISRCTSALHKRGVPFKEA